MTCLLRALASSPITLPQSAASSGFQVAATVAPGGSAVAKSLVQPALAQESRAPSSRTPWGPSAVQR